MAKDITAALEELLPVAAPVTEAPVAEAASDPNAIVGEIALNPTETVAAAEPVAFHNPTPEELAAFAPPPPIEASPLAPTAPPIPKGSVFPVAPQQTVMVDKTSHLGLTVGHVVAAPEIIADAPPAPPKEIKFEELPEKTQTEMKAGWLRAHGSLDGFHFKGNNTAPVGGNASREWPHPQGVEPITEAEVDISKLPLKTQKELAVGKARLEARNSDYRDVLRQVNEKAAAKHDAGAEADAASMDYAKGS